ncbi:MAG TPA: thioredoxin-like domain-containing protein, partial [Bacteroidales bacterium]
SKERTPLMEKYKTATGNKRDSLNKKLEDLNRKSEDFIRRKIDELPPNSMLAALLKISQEIKVPDFPRDGSGKVTDSAFQYKYYKAHYFDNFDFTDGRLLRTPLYEQKIKFYLEKMIPPMLDSIDMEVDRFLDKTKGNEELFRYLLSTLYNYYLSSQIVGFDAVFVHIAEKYYIPYASWSSKEFIENLKKDLAKLKPTLIGQSAPNVKLITLPTDHFLAAQNDTALKSNPYLGSNMEINDIVSKYIVIVFWEADCHHCQQAMPVLHDAYERLKDKGVQVLAVNAISSVPGKRKWIDYINEHGYYDWINAWSPYSNDYRDLYNLQAFPAIFVLDENKRIISKRIGAEQVEDVINFEMRKKHE